MALNAGKIKQESNFKKPDPLEPGAYPARVVQILDLGVQVQQAWEGEEKPPKPEIYVTYETADEFLLDDDGNELKNKPRWISERFTLHSLESDLATSTKRYFAIDPTNEYGGNWAKLAAAPCTVNIVNKKKKKDGSIYDKVGSVSSIRQKDADKLPDLVNPVKIFNMDEPDMEVFGSLPEWLQNTMKENINFEGSALEAAIKGGGAKSQDKEEPKEKAENNDEEDW